MGLPPGSEDKMGRDQLLTLITQYNLFYMKYFYVYCKI